MVVAGRLQTGVAVSGITEGIRQVRRSDATGWKVRKIKWSISSKLSDLRTFVAHFWCVTWLKNLLVDNVILKELKMGRTMPQDTSILQNNPSLLIHRIYDAWPHNLRETSCVSKVLTIKNLSIIKWISEVIRFTFIITKKADNGR